MSRASPLRPDWAPSACARLRNYMQLGRWYRNDELALIGGTRFPARLHEIARGEGGAALAYDCRPVAGVDGAYEYRLREFEEGEERPRARRLRSKERIEELARENAALKARLAQLEGGAHVD